MLKSRWIVLAVAGLLGVATIPTMSDAKPVKHVTTVSHKAAATHTTPKKTVKKPVAHTAVKKSGQKAPIVKHGKKAPVKSAHRKPVKTASHKKAPVKHVTVAKKA